FYEQKKPIVAICIAPAIVAKVLGKHGITVTIGDDAGTAEVIESFGAIHKNSPVSHAVVDATHRIISCPAYMKDDEPLADIAKGIESAIKEMVSMLGRMANAA